MKKEKKTAIITARTTPEIRDLINRKAEECGLAVSNYLVECAVNEYSLLPVQKREIYRRLLVVEDYAKKREEGMDYSGLIREECNQIWNLLK